MMKLKGILLGVAFLISTVCSSFGEENKFVATNVESLRDVENILRNIATPTLEVSPEKFCLEITKTWLNEGEFSNKYDCKAVHSIWKVSDFDNIFIWVDWVKGRDIGVFLVDRWHNITFFYLRTGEFENSIIIEKTISPFKVPKGRCTGPNFTISLTFTHVVGSAILNKFSLNAEREVAVCPGGVNLEGKRSPHQLGGFSYWIQALD
ncbi:hypothetical protein [Neogemmobacter tilapiae]|uniref:Uncharacterized protein n=1 Tax=Neogemmobacter tilapiae TaxID=875041 RepID=A0A918TPS8_9RHOB|nr:hypothetical protein [Gemmobacter tilapiae]GHC58100.1 hypothetical protein GCM10007315_22070 [Gemmobacter tilapiae]